MEHATDQAVARGYLSVRHAEVYTNLSRWTLARAHKRGELPAIRIGSAVRYAVADLDHFMTMRRK